MLQVGPRCNQVPIIERHEPHGHMALQQEAWVGLALRQVEELLAHRIGGAQLRLGTMKEEEPSERPEALRRLLSLLAQRTSPCVHVAHFRARQPLCRDKQPTQNEQQREFPLRALRGCPAGSPAV